MPPSRVFIPHEVGERVLKNVVVDDDGCWISNYSVASHGYAQVGWMDKTRGKMTGTTAHRAAWVASSGEQIPEGMTVDHTCKVRPCVNPEHLRLLSNFENARRTAGRDWPLGQCINGHDNSHLVPVRHRPGKRECSE